MNDLIFNETLNYGGFLHKDAKNPDGTLNWSDPQDNYPPNTIISPNTYVPLTGWAYKMLEFPLFDKPHQKFFHNIVKISKKYWARNYTAFRTIYNLVGYTYYDTLWNSFESTMTEAEQMAWLNKQEFLKVTPDCKLHSANFTTWQEYRHWVTKQMKIQAVSYQPKIYELGFKQSNCRISRWLKFAQNPWNYVLMGYEIDAGVIMANAHITFTHYLRGILYEMKSAAEVEIMSMGLYAWDIFMMFVNLFLLRMAMIYMRSTPSRIFSFFDGRRKHKARIEQAKKERNHAKLKLKNIAIEEYVQKNPEVAEKLEIMRHLNDTQRKEVMARLRKRLLLNDENSDYIYESNYFELAQTRSPNNSKATDELTAHNVHHLRKSKVPTKHNGGAPFRTKFERYQDLMVCVIFYFYGLPYLSELFTKWNGIQRGKDAFDPYL